MKNAGSNILKSIPVLLLLLAAIYGSDGEEKKTPEVLQDILDNYAEDILYHYYISLEESGDITLNQTGSSQNDFTNIVLSSYAYSDVSIESFANYATFWLDISSSGSELRLFNPNDKQVYAFPISLPSSVNIQSIGRYSVFGNFDGDTLEGLVVQTFDIGGGTIPNESYYLNLENLQIENYYQYDSVEEELKELLDLGILDK
jgi:hypothetical protein